MWFRSKPNKYYSYTYINNTSYTYLNNTNTKNTILSNLVNISSILLMELFSQWRSMWLAVCINVIEIVVIAWPEFLTGGSSLIDAEHGVDQWRIKYF